MKVNYANSKHPERLARILGAVMAVGFAGYLSLFSTQRTGWFIVRAILYLAAIVAMVWFPLGTVKCTVDEEDETLFTPENKKVPMKIADIDRITRVTNRKGKLRYLNIHEAGVRFVDVRLFPSQAEALISHLLRINPSITVQDKNYM